MSDSPPRATVQPEGPGQQLIGTTIAGRYKVEALLGAGGMGAVYLVQHTYMRKRFALKILNTQIAQLPEMAARFEREAMAAAHVEHPNITAATDFGKTEDGAFFLVLEYLEGKRLRDALGADPLETRRAMHIARQVASALERSHALGVIHRDLKPENIMLVSRQGDPDFVKVLDFGLAKVAAAMLEPGSGTPAQALTQHGAVFGTPKYMAPEQCVSGLVDGRTDLYALGIILYEMLTGVHPFAAKDNLRIIMHQISTPTPPMKTVAPAVAVPASLEAVVMRLTEKEPEKRYANATEVLAALNEVAEREGFLPLEPSGRVAASPSRPGLPSKDANQSVQSISGVEVVSEAALTPASGKQSAQQFPSQSASGPRPGAAASSADSGVSGSSSVQPSSAPVQSEPSTARTAVTPSMAGESRTAENSRPQAAVSSGNLHPFFLVKLLHSLRSRLPAQLQNVPPALLLGAPIALLGLILFLLLRTGTSTEPASKRAAKSPAAPALAASAQIDRARTQGLSALLGLAQQFPQDARIQRSLAEMYIAQKDGISALRCLAKALTLDESSVAQGEVRQAATLALNAPETTDAAFSLLESELGARGVDVLYTLASRSGQNRIKTRSSLSLSKPEVRAHASRAALIALDLRAAEKCEARRALLPRAAKDGDQRTLELLKPMMQTLNCGPMGLVDCWSCLRQDTALQRAIAAIEARVKPRN